jgi:hypothetical protein
LVTTPGERSPGVLFRRDEPAGASRDGRVSEDGLLFRRSWCTRLAVKRALFQRKTTVVLLLILCAVFVWFVVSSYTGAVQQNRTRAVAAQFGHAMHELQQSPPGIPRVESFLGRLKAIDATKAAPEVRQALTDYIAAVEPSLEAARNGRTIAPYDQAIMLAKQRLVDAVRENE